MRYSIQVIGKTCDHESAYKVRYNEVSFIPSCSCIRYLSTVVYGLKQDAIFQIHLHKRVANISLSQIHSIKSCLNQKLSI